MIGPLRRARPSWPGCRARWRPGAPTRSASTWPPSATRSSATRPTASAARRSALTRPFLHAAELAFDHPATGERLTFTSPLPADLAAFLATLSLQPSVEADRCDGGRRTPTRAGDQVSGAGSVAVAGHGASPWAIARDVGERVAVEVVAHVLAGLVPHGDQHALALVVARPVLVRLAEVAERDRTVDGRHDLRQLDLLGVAGEDVAAADAALGAHQPGALEGQQDLLEVGLGQAGALGDVAHRRRPVAVGVERQRQQRPAGVVTSGRDAHDPNRTGRCDRRR